MARTSPRPFCPKPGSSKRFSSVFWMSPPIVRIPASESALSVRVENETESIRVLRISASSSASIAGADEDVVSTSGVVTDFVYSTEVSITVSVGFGNSSSYFKSNK